MAVPLTGYKFKKDQLAAVDVAKNAADAQEKTKRDRDYDLTIARERAEWTDIASGGASACGVASLVARQEENRFLGQLADLSGKQARPIKAQMNKAKAKADLLDELARKSDEERQQAIEAAHQNVEEKEAAATNAAVTLVQLRQQETDLRQAANAIPNLDPVWERAHSAPERSMRSLEADLRAMQADLTRLGANAPPGALAYCNTLEAKLDHDAHHVPCPRCGAEHGLDRTAQAKTEVRQLFQEMERLGALLNDNGLTAQQVRDRSIATGMNALQAAEQGKMLGVLICTDGTRLQAFSGDSAGIDDVEGWCDHSPPVDQGGSFQTANGVTVPLSALPAVVGAPHGVCAAPKLIQQAYRMGKMPAAIAEIWYGGGLVQPHGSLVASCATCRSNLDVQLCNRYPI
jgi:hypothetical protein